ncbi:GTP cyclohydrolase II [Lysinibacillus pakistanensis]|uniref:GTP cyclohydrolase II n=1 Tax=Lysinibacillus pakistanensis TaxID=759811 RepID=A0AAX3X229_9BACI|nr:GTP cyclohydrolase II [Lysinibacillus pakistanensis]MDM5232446.1 GTP cyclohydrolase II [Lysinibacillus pakistanensis]WHY47957.1 GTP cyclohydrolase II [Lysinibacillus pakistanensis]WHY52969.1 GTP cyclohydrolase II [Lysinibacillus pakistanensis]
MTITTKVMDIVKDKMIIVQHSKTENICLVGPVKLPVKQGDFSAIFQWYNWLKLDTSLSKEEIIDGLASANLAFSQQSSVLVYGDFTHTDDALIRMHSICHTGDIFGSQRCDCGYQLHESMKMIVEHGCGAIFYLADHEGRGIGLFSKSLAYLLQEEGLDTVEANHALGFSDDTRSYEEAITVLGALRSKPVTLITNNPKKLAALQAHGLAAEGHVPLWGGLTETNSFYLNTKVEKSGHIREEK